MTTTFAQVLHALWATVDDGSVECVHPLAHPAVRLFWARGPIETRPLLLDASLVLVGTGLKTGQLGTHAFTYHPAQYLLVSAPVPFVCASPASADAPLLGLTVDIEPARLQAVLDVLRPTASSSALEAGVTPADFHPALQGAAVRLAAALLDPVEAALLGDALVTGVLLEAARGSHGHVLQALAARGPSSAIAAVLTHIRAHPAAAHPVNALARRAGMGVSTFHRAFRVATGDTPARYVKAVRLHRAHELLRDAAARVSTVAHAVGYESAAQFSRDFKGRFGVSPRDIHMR